MRNMNPLPTLPKNLIQLVYPGGVSLFLSRFGVYLVTFSTHKKNLSEVDRLEGKIFAQTVELGMDAI